MAGFFASRIGFVCTETLYHPGCFLSRTPRCDLIQRFMLSDAGSQNQILNTARN